MITFPNAKINLGLHVTAKRPDGFHDLETCFYPVTLHEALEIIPADTSGLNVSGTEYIGEIADNLCFKAWKLLSDKHDIPPISLHLHKYVPMGAGLGGGSADAAYTLKMLNELFALRLSPSKLMEYASELGSDCAFFINNKPIMASGKGNEFSPADLSLKGKWCVVVHPGIHVSTADAYRMIMPKRPKRDLKTVVEGDISNWREELINDFETPIFEKHAEIKAIKGDLYDFGAFYAAMSGSGSAVFGLFEREPELNKQDFKGCFFWKGVLD